MNLTPGRWLAAGNRGRRPEPLGFESPVIEARYSGGTCPLCKGKVWQGKPLVRFRGRGWCHATCAHRVLLLEDELASCDKPHADPKVAAAYAASRPEVARELETLLKA